ncbi:MAG: hypothetical protein KAS75_06085 [Planctomycetes bacterium]|nr:hypothetical protein [Planctomycetota bacterium]
MLESLLNFEERAAFSDPVFLVVPGLGLAILGLFIWLGGFGFRKSLAAIIGGIGGSVGGYFITNQNTIMSLLLGMTAAIIAVIFEGALTKGSFWRRLLAALLCSVLGVAFIFTGMTLLLLYKGVTAISYISYQLPFYGSIFAAMAIFGIIVHLSLCQHTRKKIRKKKEADEIEEAKEKPLSWRGK